MLIKNGLLVYEGKEEKGDILVEDEKIVRVGSGIEAEADEVIDAEGQIVIPGGIDPHTHMDLQQSEKFRSCDDFYTGGVAAANGGTTTIIDHIGFGPSGCNLNYSINEYKEKALKSPIDYSFHGVIQHVDDNILEELSEIVKNEGITSFKAYTTYGYKVGDSDVFRLFETLKKAGGILTVHCENDEIIGLLRSRSLAEGKTAPVWHAKTRPPETEAEAAGSIMDISKLCGDAPFYIVHTSAGYTIDKVRQAFDLGLKNTHVETCTQYLLLTEDKYSDGGNEEGIKYLMSPPLRKIEDVEKLWDGIFDGTVETIGTDHCPFLLKDKMEGLEDYTKAPGGAPGVEERIRVVYTEGVVKRGLSLSRYVDLVSTNAAKIFGLYPRKGTLSPGSDADIVILDPNMSEILRAESLKSSCDYSLYDGYESECTVRLVMQRGKILKNGDNIFAQSGDGKFIKRLPKVN
ncbi:MAG: dihydropyrimidinase [Clostridiaceae bacterium]